ncbi:hypothetical protein [Tannerella forsythia]|uniref:hypothetical protein n=1 Tax=Tannerella forsythia TaxID=28112 RepID=UPI000BE72344|nr:hypothetical protein [Tannerella forsythia]PDP70731.1 hypothetical protein CLI85_07680 [Tannerella forsythia]
MKQIYGIIVFLLLSATAGMAQNDSISIRFISLNRDLTLLNRLNNIQYTGFTCTDTLAHGKQFLLYTEEYENGEKVRPDSTDLECKEQRIPMEVNGKTIEYLYDPCRYRTFLPGDSVFRVALAGKLEADTFRLLMDYPAICLTKKLRGNADYSLRTISCDDDESMKLPVNKLTPVFAYTPPYDTGKGMASYCILDAGNARERYATFGIKHYYIIYLIIR